ncbi:MAG: hypothetical protein ACE5KA_09230 [Nitrososphaerales archaeon]
MTYRTYSKKGRIATLGAGTIVGILALSLFAANLTTNPILAEHKPADKIAVAGAIAKFMACSANDSSTGGNTPALDTCADAATDVGAASEGASGTVTIFGGDSSPIIMKTSSPTDVYYLVTMECATWTDIAVHSKKGSKGDTSNDLQDSSAMASVVVYIQYRELDEKGVPISDWYNVGVVTGDDGEVTFCDRSFQIKTNILSQIQDLCLAVNNLEDAVGGLDPEFQEILDECEESYLQLFLRSKGAHAFQWIRLNLGAGQHEFRVQAELTTSVDGDGTAVAAVGKRTFSAIPGKLANDATI